ncbi:MAG: hypothetical protein AAFR56_18700 [Chloroflexota bacterium]
MVEHYTWYPEATQNKPLGLELPGGGTVDFNALVDHEIGHVIQAHLDSDPVYNQWRKDIISNDDTEDFFS